MEHWDATDVYRTDSIRCFTVSDVLVYTGSYETYPPDEAWEGYLDVVRRLVHRLHGLLVVTSGKSTLTPKQRARVRSVFGGFPVHTAVLTDSFVTRGTLTALGWFGIPIAGFPTSDRRQALTWMKREQLWEEVERRLREISRERHPKLAGGMRT